MRGQVDRPKIERADDPRAASVHPALATFAQAAEGAPGSILNTRLRAPNGNEVDFPPLSEGNLGVAGINNKGWIIGSYEDNDYLYQGFVWKP
jgi:hypothetical protein